MNDRERRRGREGQAEGWDMRSEKSIFTAEATVCSAVETKDIQSLFYY